MRIKAVAYLTQFIGGSLIKRGSETEKEQNAAKRTLGRKLLPLKKFG